MIDSVELHSITIYKHEMDLKLYALTFKVGKCITIVFLVIIEIQFNCKFKYLNI
jgi:hypothetical protein